MTRATESGAYLGGIGTMLTQSDVCPACGRVHADARSILRTGARRECPLVVFGTLPTLARLTDLDLPSETPSSAALDLEAETDVPAAPRPQLPPKKGPGLTIPWPMPSHLEDFL